MKNVTISMPETTLAYHRQEAAKRGLSLNAWLRQVLAYEAGISSENPAEAFVSACREIAPSAKSWEWNRDEIYEDRLNPHAVVDEAA